MIATGFPLVSYVLLQTSTAPFPMPQTYGEGLLIFSVAVAAGAAWRSVNERAKRAEHQVDSLTAALPELLLLLREWKEAQHGRAPKNGN